MNTYNGWKNYETWAMALWITSDEYVYNIAYHSRNWTHCRIRLENHGYTECVDGISFRNSRLSGTELTKMIKELR